MIASKNLLPAFAVALGCATAPQAVAAASIKVFEGDDVAYTLFPTLDPGRVDALTLGSAAGPGAEPFEIGVGGSFGLNPLGGGVTGFFLNIFDADQTLVLEGFALAGQPMVMAGPSAEVAFVVSSGAILDRFRPDGVLRLSGFTKPDSVGTGSVDVEVLLSVIPAPAAGPLLACAVAALALARARRRAVAAAGRGEPAGDRRRGANPEARARNPNA
ncbi:hypothetical protein [Rubrimonas sp.]|uniref:hypothetical protein n=1 Tax=Rubrimonas sp. TaxID=2036015 RepID=UPI002FDCEABE